MESFAQKAIAFHKNLHLDLSGLNVEVLNPFREEVVLDVIEQFYGKFFNDANSRTFLFGINPGRFGAGITGISFTDPINLEENCEIENDFRKKHELSSQFIYQVIDAYGGAKKFYSRFFMTAISPLGFVKDGKNINYYDEKELTEETTPFIEKTMLDQVTFGMHQKCAICVGGGKNLKYFTGLNRKLKIYDEIIPLDHPRFIMQYRRRSLNQYVKKYLDVLKFCESVNNS